VADRWEDRFGSVEGTFREYCTALGDFKKNHFNTWVGRVCGRWLLLIVQRCSWQHLEVLFALVCCLALTSLASVDSC
jgi:hypothetical protein